jgi:hypothetical protein
MNTPNLLLFVRMRCRRIARAPTRDKPVPE